MVEYCQHVQDTIIRMQDDSICKNCPELIEIPANKTSASNILFQTVSFNMHRYLCNCKCVYCDFHKQTLLPYSILPAINSLYSQNVLHKDCFFSWGGGEPTILREFEEAATLIYNYGFKQYIHTNALHYSNTIAGLLEKQSAGVNISLDSGNPEVYKAVKGLDGFKRVTANIGKYIAASRNECDITIKYIIFSANNSQQMIEDFFALCKYLGIKNVEFSFDFREVNDGTVSNETLDAAISFIALSNALNIKCSPFFVDNQMIKMLEDRVNA